MRVLLTVSANFHGQPSYGSCGSLLQRLGQEINVKSSENFMDYMYVL